MANQNQLAKIEKLKLDFKQVTRGFSVLNSNQAQKLFNATPAKWQYERPGKAGQKWKYVRKTWVRRQLDSVFGFDWDFTVETGVKEAFEVAQVTGAVVLKGRLVARTRDERGQLLATLTKEDFGRAEVKFKQEVNKITGNKELLDFGNDMKSAATDCFKRCASHFGIAADVYDPGEFIHIEILDSEENSKLAENRKRQIKEAKDALEQQSDKVGGEND